MSRSLYALAVLLLACAALAAPAPEPFVSGWGNPIDPNRDCKIRRNGKTLIIEMLGSNHDYDPRREQFNAPRLLRDFEGNFDMQVGVHIDCFLSTQSTVEGQPSCVSAGFLVILPNDFPSICDRMEYGLTRKGSGTNGCPVLKRWNKDNRQWSWVLDRGWKWENIDKWQGSEVVVSGWKGDPYLRLEHRGGNLTFSISSDGENWIQLTTTVGTPAKLKVGLIACSTSTEPSKVRFDQLKLTRGKKKE